MLNNYIVGICYCGGCNPRYDRVALVQSLEGDFPNVIFEPFCPEKNYTATLVICGCPVQCSVRTGAKARPQEIFIRSPEDLTSARAILVALARDIPQN